jgi:hypothetical protein
MRRRTIPLVDHERGGEAIGVPTFNSPYDWTCVYEDGIIKVYRNDLGVRHNVLTRADVTHLGMAFDQSMTVYLCFTDGAGSWLYYYNSSIEAMDFLFLGADAITPCMCLDEKRTSLSGDSDVIVSYIKDDELCCRVQREAFLTENVLDEVPAGATLTGFGPNTHLRLQWRIHE